MSSRFVSGGRIDAESGETVAGGEDPASASAATGKSARSQQKQEEWEAVQRELDAERRRREEQRAKMAAGEERTLYDVLQANKAAKQAAFEEQTRLRNQFRPLDDDEVEFLDGVRDSARRDEERLRRETEDGLRRFREARRDTAAREKGEGEGEREEEVSVEDWDIGARKRKRERDAERDKGRLVKGVKRRASSGVGGDEGKGTHEVKVAEKLTDSLELKRAEEPPKAPELKTAKTTSASRPAKQKLSLVAYGSDDDEDEDD